MITGAMSYNRYRVQRVGTDVANFIARNDAVSQVLLIPGLDGINLQRVLFGANEVGGIWDWSDRSTMFQDIAGTQPITASGQTRALHLDKSRGLVLGSQQVTNGEFVGNTTGWIAVGSATLAHDPTNAAIIDITGIGGGISDNQVFSLTPGKMYQFDVVIKAGTFPGQLAAQIAGNNVLLINLSGNYVKHSGFFFAATADPALRIVRNTGDTGTVLINSISVRELPGNHRYQANLSNRPQYIEDATGHYGLYDGVDDWDETNAVDFGGTDKMTVWWGGRKLSDAAFQALIDLTANPDTTTGAFSLAAATLLGDAPGRRTYGAFNWSVSGVGSGVFTSPTSNVICSIHDTAQPTVATQSLLRVNGIQQITTTTGIPVSGNYANAKLYFGRRGGTTFAANIREYMTIIRGAATPTNIIQRVERAVARKVGISW